MKVVFTSLVFLCIAIPTQTFARSFCRSISVRIGFASTHAKMNPQINFESSRLRIRALGNSASDISFYFDLVREDRSQNFRADWGHPFMAASAFRGDLKTHRTGEGYRFIVEQKESGRSIGMISYHQWSPSDRSIELGAVLDSKSSGEGYMSEAIPVTFDHLRELGIKTVIAKVLPTNGQSMNLAKRLGFVRVGDERVRNPDGTWGLYDVLELKI